MTKKKKPSPQKILRQILLVLMTIFAAVAAVIFLLPTVLTITNSFMSQTEINANYGMIFSTTTGGYVSKTVNLKFIPDKVTLSQYINGLIKSPEYLLKFWNSVLLVVPIVIFQVAIASVAAYSFTRWRGKIRSGIFFFYVILMLMPYQVTLVPNYLVSKWLGILNTSWAIILPGVFAPFSVFLLTKFMRRIPYSLIEAAKVDGATAWQTFWKVKIPNLMPTITICLFLSITNGFKLFDQNLALTGGAPAHSTEMLALNIYNTFYSRAGIAWQGIGQAKAVIFCILVVAISMIQLKATRSKEVQQ